MELQAESGKLTSSLARFSFALSGEQAQQLAEIGESQSIQAGQEWESWEQFLQAHELEA